MLCAPAERVSLEVLTNTLGVPLGTAKAMVFKKRGLLNMAPDELLDRVRTVADVVGVTTDQAIEMVTIQPGLLFDTQVGWGWAEGGRGRGSTQHTALDSNVGAGEHGRQRSCFTVWSMLIQGFIVWVCSWL
jgi:hypothetical protein